MMITVFGDIKKDTDMAYLVDVYLGDAVWIPKSQIRNRSLVNALYVSGTSEGVEFKIPEWLAEDKEIV